MAHGPSQRQGVRRGDLFLADLSPVVGSEQGGFRPVVVLQNDIGNRYSPTVIVAAITSRLQKNPLPTHVPLPAEGEGLLKPSIVLAEHIRTIDKRRLRERIGSLPSGIMAEVNRAVALSLGLGEVMR